MPPLPPPLADPGLVAGGSVTSRRRPYPWDVLLNGQGLRLREGVMGKRVLPLENYQATVQEYGTDNLYQERSFTYRRAYSGMGDSTLPGNGVPPRYAYGKNAWKSGAYRGRGPRWHPLTPLGGHEGAFAGVVEAPGLAGAPELLLLALAGRYVRRVDGLTDATQALSLDLGAGVVAETAVRWEPAGVGGMEGVYLTDSASRLWRYQADAWDELTGAPDARFVCSTGVELWRAAGNAVSKCEQDPDDPASWTAEIRVGDPFVAISGLGQIWGQLFVFKEDGTVWTLQGGADLGRARNIAPGLAVSPDPGNGRRPAFWDGGLYFRVGSGFWKLTVAGGASLERVGPERLVDNRSPVRGPVVAFAGYDAYGAYGTVYHEGDGASYLLAYGDWVPGEEGSPEGGSFRFLPAWNGSLLDLAGKRVTGMGVTQLEAVCGAPDPANPWEATDRGNPLLFLGFDDGTYGYVTLPRDGGSPFSPGAHLAHADFTDQESWLRWPRHSLMAPGDLKAFLSFSATGPVLDQYRAVLPEFRVDAVGEDTAWQPVSRTLTGSGQRVEFPADTVGKVLELRETYVTQTPVDDEMAHRPGPVVASLTLREQLRPAFRLEYAGTVLAHHKVARRDGGSSRLTPVQTRNLIVAAAQLPGHVTLTMPDETVSRFALIHYQEQVPPDGGFRRRGLAWDIGLSMVTYSTLSVFGIFDRLNLTTFGDLDASTFGDLSGW